MIRIFLNPYIAPPDRITDQIFALKQNINNSYIDKIHIYLTDDIYKYLPVSDKLNYLPYVDRPTYKKIFNDINELNISNDDISIVLNSDIFLDDSIKHVLKMDYNDALCLSRWDYKDSNNSILFNDVGSQDTWIFKGPIKDVQNIDFTMGVLGCDNSLAWWLKEAGYNMKNPAHLVKTHHVHNSTYRTWKNDDRRIPHPYLCISLSNEI